MRSLDSIKILTILGLVFAASAGVRASSYEEVPGRVVLRLTEAGAKQLHKGELLIPVPQEALGLTVDVAPVFRAYQGPLSRFALLTWDVGLASQRGLNNNHWIEAAVRSESVVSAESDGLVFLSGLPDDPEFDKQFQLLGDDDLSLHGADAWPFISPDDEVVVAILDSGVEWHHPDLGGLTPALDEAKGVMWLNQAEADGAANVDDDGNGFVDDFIGWDFVDVPSIPPEYNAPDAVVKEDGALPDNNPQDYSGHGTYCAGLVTAITNNDLGIAGHPSTRIMSVRVAYSNETSIGYQWAGGVAFFTWIAAALEYAADAGADVASCSFHMDFWPEIMQSALNHAVYTKGMAVVAAAGNFGTSSIDAGQGYLASQPEVIGVAGVQPSGRKWSGSNFGNWVSIAAFARGLPSTYQREDFDTYAFHILGEGTSWACPQVAGQVGLLRLVAPELTPLELVNVVESTGTDLTPYDATYGPDKLGGGLANIPASIEAAGGGWKRDLRAFDVTPMGSGKVAVLADSAVTVIDAATAEVSFSWSQEVPVPVPPVVLQNEEEEFLAFAYAGPGTHALHLLDESGEPVSGWPVELAGEPKAIALTDWGEAGAHVVVVLGDSGVTVYTGAGELVVSEGGFMADHLLIGDFDPGTPGMEITGYGNNAFYILSSQDFDTQTVSGFTSGPADPVAVFLDNEESVVFAASGGSVYAFSGGLVPKTGFPVNLGEAAIEHLSILGKADGSVYALAADANGGLHRIGLEGEVISWDALGSFAGEPLSVDLDQDFQAEALLAMAHGALQGRTPSLQRSTGFPREFPAGLTGTPAAVDHPDGHRYLAVTDESGRLWSLPLKHQAEGPLSWSCSRGSNQRTGTVTQAEATPVISAALTWVWSDGGQLCWNLIGDGTVEAYRVDTPREQRVLSGNASCVQLAGMQPGEEVVLYARGRGELRFRELGRLRLPPLVRAPLRAFPNPFYQEAELTFAPALPGAEIEVFDVQGRLVARDAVGQGTSTYRWSGRDQSGDPVSPGLYFLRLVQGGGSQTVKLIKTP